MTNMGKQKDSIFKRPSEYKNLYRLLRTLRSDPQGLGYRNKYNFNICERKKYLLQCVLKKRCLKYQKAATILQQAAASILGKFYCTDKKKLIVVPKSEIFVYFTKIKADTWSINKIILVSIALLIPMQNNLDWSISSYPRSPTLEFI